MQQFETFHPLAPELTAEEPEPLPTTEETLREHLQHIEALWSEHAEARSLTGSREHLEMLRTDLYDAYDRIDKIKGFLEDDTTELLVGADLLEAARFELWFSSQTLHKVLK